MTKAKGKPLGRRPKDDFAALRDLRAILREHRRWSPYKAALYYAERHPEEGIQPASTARRLADKLREELGALRRRTGRRSALLKQLATQLANCAALVEQLRRIDRDRPD